MHPPLGQALLQGATADLPRPSTSSTSDTKSNGILDLTSAIEPAADNANGNNTGLLENTGNGNECKTDTHKDSSVQNTETNPSHVPQDSTESSVT